MKFSEIQNVNSLKMHQKKDFSELFFEKGNRYVVLDERDQEIAFINEKKSGFWNSVVRFFIKNLRSYDVSIFDRSKALIINCQYPFKLWFREFYVYDDAKRKVAMIKPRIKFLKRCFDIFDESGKVLFVSESRPSKLWTFPIQKDGKDVCIIKKKWSGFGKELFTNADNFTIDFLDSSLKESDKIILLAMGVYLDLALFEMKR